MKINKKIRKITRKVRKLFKVSPFKIWVAGHVYLYSLRKITLVL